LGTLDYFAIVEDKSGRTYPNYIYLLQAWITWKTTTSGIGLSVDIYNSLFNLQGLV